MIFQQGMQGAIFDLDGTLLDSIPFCDEAGEEIYQRYAFTPTAEELAAVVPMTIVEAAKYFYRRHTFPVSEEDFIAQKLDAFARRYRERVPRKPGVLPYLQSLRQRGIPMCAATATDRSVILPALERLELLPFFDAVFTCTEVGENKSVSAKVFLTAAEFMGLAPESLAVFEDSLFALRHAKSAGFYTVGVYDESAAKNWAVICQEAHQAVHRLDALLPKEAKR